MVCRVSARTVRGCRCRSFRAPCRCSPAATWLAGRTARCARAGTAWLRAAPSRACSSGVFWSPRVNTVIEPLEPFAGPEGAYYKPVFIWDGIKNDVEEYLAVFGRPDQIAAWRKGRPFVAVLADA